MNNSVEKYRQELINQAFTNDTLRALLLNSYNIKAPRANKPTLIKLLALQMASEGRLDAENKMRVVDEGFPVISLTAVTILSAVLLTVLFVSITAIV